MPLAVRAAKWVVPAVMWVVSFGRESGGGKVRVVGVKERERGSWVRLPVVSGGCEWKSIQRDGHSRMDARLKGCMETQQKGMKK